MKTFKPILLLLLVFVAGAIFGIVGTRVVVRAMILRAVRHSDLVRERIERELDRKLKLDDQQRRETHETLLATQRQLRDLRGEVQPRFSQILTNAQARISATLNPTQRAAFEKMREQHRFLLAPPATPDLP